MDLSPHIENGGPVWTEEQLGWWRIAFLAEPLLGLLAEFIEPRTMLSFYDQYPKSSWDAKLGHDVGAMIICLIQARVLWAPQDVPADLQRWRLTIVGVQMVRDSEAADAVKAAAFATYDSDGEIAEHARFRAAMGNQPS